FLKKLWRLFYNQNGEWVVTEEAPAPAELKVLHKTIKKVQEDIENLSFNTSVSAFMVCVNELSDLKCSKKSVLSDLLILLSPFAPHICEELWSKAGNNNSITKATFPAFNANYLVESSFSYPISINGKVRTNIEMDLSLESKEVEARVLADETVQKWLEGKQPKKVIHVKGRIVNVVV
ncbi:MAG: class I tRNA ligase family protein, partial [Bacteroidia bacterium]|nr:class I tRNA ligase family protein [Bacteroidia bacterium]